MGKAGKVVPFTQRMSFTYLINPVEYDVTTLMEDEKGP